MRGGVVLLLAIVAAGCAQNDALVLDWLDPGDSATRSEERFAFDALALKAHADKFGFHANATGSGDDAVLWMRRRRAWVEFECFTPGPRQLVIDAGTPSESPGRELGVDLILDGEALATDLRWVGAQRASIELPAERLRPGRHRIEWRVHQPDGDFDELMDEVRAHGDRHALAAAVEGLGDTTNGSQVSEPLIFDPSLDVWFAANDPSVATYYEIEDRFVAEDYVMVTFSTAGGDPVDDELGGIDEILSEAKEREAASKPAAEPGERQYFSLEQAERWLAANDH